MLLSYAEGEAQRRWILVLGEFTLLDPGKKGLKPSGLPFWPELNSFSAASVTVIHAGVKGKDTGCGTERTAGTAKGLGKTSPKRATGKPSPIHT